MRWAEWEPVYEAILADFGYDRKADEDARDLLAVLASGHARLDPAALAERIRGREVAIAGPIPTRAPDGIPLLATDAARWAFDHAFGIVTDLDGDVEAQIASGKPMIVHAHGDNTPALRRWVPLMRAPMLGTTQTAPLAGLVENYGGFTDGDRACCLAVELGAASLVLVGFDFNAPAAKAGRDSGLKRRKLAWARRIIDSLGVPVKMG